MKGLSIFGALGVVLVGLAWSSSINAQSPPEKAKDATKVYAYKKIAPSSKQTGHAPAQQARNVEPDVIPFGTPDWWRKREWQSGSSAE